MRRALLALALFSAAGCVPSRDNAHDPSRSPDVRVDVLRLLRDDLGNCQVPNDGPEVVSAASRGDCLQLDASRTTDPQGHSMRFTYFVVDSSGGVGEILAENTDAETIDLPKSALGAPPEPGVTFGVRAKDSTGAVATGFVTLGMVNSPPVLPQPGERVLPAGGFPWAPGVPMEIVLDGGIVHDADGDSLQYCWTTTTTPLDQCEEFTPTWTRSIAPDAGRAVYNLEVFDGQFDSEKRSFVVRVGPPALWDAREALRRFDETLRVWNEPAPGRSWIVRGELGEEWFLFQETATAEVAIYAWPEMTDTGLTIDLGDPADAVTSTTRDGGGTRIWLAAPGPGATTDVFVYDLDENGTALTPVRNESVAVPARTVFAADSFADAALVAGGDTVAIVPGAIASGPPAIFQTDGLTIEGGSARPQAAENGGAAHFLLVGTLPGTPVYQSFLVTPTAGAPDIVPDSNLLSPPMRQFEWIDHEQLWSVWPGAGLTLFEINNFRVFAQVPEIQEVDGPLLVDGSGAVHFKTASALVSVARDGRMERHPLTSSDRRIDFVSADGTLGIDDGAGVMRFSRTGSLDAIRTTVDLEPAGPRRSIAGGSVWAVEAPAVVRVSEDGRVERFITILDVEGNAVPLVSPVVAIDPDERGAWLRDGGLLYRLNEIEIDPLFPQYEEAFLVNAPIQAASFEIAGASSPAAAAPFLWMWNPATFQIATLSTQGAFAPTSALPALPSTFVVDPRTSDLCVFTRIDATTVRHHRFTPLGVETFDDVTVADSTSIRSPFASAAPAVCGVVAGTSPSRILVWDSAAALVASGTETDEISSVIPFADGEYWAAGESTVGERFLTKLVTGSSGTLTRSATYPIDVPLAPVFLP